MLTHTVLRHEGEAVTGKRGADGHCRGIEHQPSLDAHAEFAAPFLELPGIEAAGGRQPQIDAVMLGQVLGRARGFRPLK
jgi:hypothetical protein